MSIMFALLLSFALSFALTPLFMSVAWRLKVLDYPDANKIHSQPTPLLGGAAVFFSFFITSLLFISELNNMYIALFVASAIIFISGIVDDIKPFSAVKRLIIQFIAAIILIYGGISFTFLPNTLLGRASEIALTIIWIVGITNAFNYLDGLNGLASGAAIINAFFFCIFANTTGQSVLAYLLVIFIGACTGFFPYNFFKGYIFLGNSGSTWLGFTLAGLAVIGDWAIDNPVDLVIPILIFGVPIFDMINTTTVRILDKKTENMVDLLAYRGNDHFHHRLSQIGLGRKGAVFFIYVVCIMLGLNALLLQLSQGLINVVIILCVSALFFVLISSLLRVPLQKNEGKEVLE
jgi:UDP-GlcNAc:undecaprenyl-phosphate GlcNAc-1-phosphate transferase